MSFELLPDLFVAKVFMSQMALDLNTYVSSVHEVRPAETRVQNVTVVERILEIISQRPFRMNDEKRLQAELEEILLAEGVRHRREVDLGGGDVIDFMFENGVGMEVKIRESKRAIYRQCRRYCLHPEISALILLTGTALGFPEELEGKPCYVVSMGGGWL